MGTTAALMLVLFASIALIIFLIMKVRLHAFVALIVACMFVGFATGMPLAKIGASIEAGMGGTLGFLATILVLAPFWARCSKFLTGRNGWPVR